MRKKTAIISAIIVFLVTILIGNTIASLLPDATNNAQRDVEAIVGILQLFVPIFISWATYRIIRGKKSSISE